MDRLKNRQYTKVVAILDIILSAISLALLTIGVLYLLAITVGVYSERVSLKDEGMIMVVAICIVVILSVLAEIAKIFAAVKLLRATKIETNPKEALGLCTFWRNVNIFFLVLNVLALIMGRNGWAIISIVICCISLYIVHLYMKELAELIANPNSLPIVVSAPYVQYFIPGTGGTTGPPLVFYGGPTAPPNPPPVYQQYYPNPNPQYPQYPMAK